MEAKDSTVEVLFVDDEENTLKYLSRAFSDVCRLRTAKNVDEAISILQDSRNVGVVITDQVMPGARGTDLLHWLATNRPHIVRILTTAYADLNSAIESINRGEVFRFVEKPWALDDLENLIKDSIGRFREQLSPADYDSVSDEILLHNLFDHVSEDCESWKLYAMHSLDRLSDYEAGIEAIAAKHSATLSSYLADRRLEKIGELLDRFIDERFLSNQVLAQVQVAVSKSFNSDTNH